MLQAAAAKACIPPEDDVSVIDSDESAIVSKCLMKIQKGLQLSRIVFCQFVAAYTADDLRIAIGCYIPKGCGRFQLKCMTARFSLTDQIGPTVAY